MPERTQPLLDRILDALGVAAGRPHAELLPGGSLPSAFAVSDLAQAAVAAAGSALSRVVDPSTPPGLTVDRNLASAWFTWSVHPDGWQVPDAWDPLAGDYAGQDGWIRLHTNAPPHRAAALAALGVPGERELVADAVSRWAVDDLEAAVVETGGAAAAMRSMAEWDAHPQGMAVASEPLVQHERTAGEAGAAVREVDPARPLAGLRVLDLTRVLAGPVATRLLAGWGAEVLRIDPPSWDEPAIVPEVTLGKRCAHVDLTTGAGRSTFLGLLASADVLVHGYRSDALERLDLGADLRSDIRPGLVDVSLDAYGWSGPWSTRRGFDSLVQMSSGIADAGMAAAGSDRPFPLPVQALDHAAGYLLAASALTGLAERTADGRGSRWRTSLAAVSRLLVDAGVGASIEGRGVGDVEPAADAPVEHTAWGVARRIPAPLAVAGAPLRWDLPACPLGTAEAAWLGG